MAADTMEAAYVPQLGPASLIRVGQLPVPDPGPSEVLVEVDAVAVNPVDTYVRSGRYSTPVPMPLIVGRDLVGTVAALGSPALPFAVGDPVWCNSMGHEGRQGPSAQYAVVPAERLYHLPPGVDARTAVALAHPAATAYLGWFVHAGLRPAQTVFVGGGGGNVGTAAIQIAASAGARVLASARPQDHERCHAAGAQLTWDYRDPNLSRRVLEAAPAGVDAFWETSGHHDFALVQALAATGCRVLVTASTGQHQAVPLAQMYPRDVALLGFAISRATVSDLAAAARLINHMLPQGSLTTRITDCLPLTEAARAHQRLETGQVRGRLLLTI